MPQEEVTVELSFKYTWLARAALKFYGWKGRLGFPVDVDAAAKRIADLCRIEAK